MKRIIIGSLLFCVFNIEPLGACTIFYFAKDGIILAGNNEDWKDPATKMWIYPAEAGKNGWIKFGFGSGFPQGGMNDQGVFWDGTAGPYLDMPYSVANKIEYSGPLMKKVIEECSNLSETEALLQSYYCEDQFRAQYLIGDASGHSMISEGDSIIKNSNSYQVLTNFYQSNPDLGGYPCWRFEKAVELLEKCDTLTPYYTGSILASTHQEGKYPTQYSTIYDLQRKTVLLFYFHNYDEFLLIDLQKEMKLGYQSYDIPSIFSKIVLMKPENGEEVTGNSATISWKGLPGNSYKVFYSMDSDFSDPQTMEVTASVFSREENKVSLHFVPLLLLLVLPLIKLKRRGLFFGLVAVLLINIACNKEEITEEDNAVEINATLEGLQANTIYYWKIIAINKVSGHFSTETVTRSFVTGEG